jgi:hypothetical protein
MIKGPMAEELQKFLGEFVEDQMGVESGELEIKFVAYQHKAYGWQFSIRGPECRSMSKEEWRVCGEELIEKLGKEFGLSNLGVANATRISVSLEEKEPE